MDHYQLTRFELKDAGNNNAVVLVTGSLRYKAILQRAFNQHYFSRTFEDRFGRYEWGTYIYNIDISERARVEALLKMFQQVVCIEDDLTETFALDYHTQMNPTGGYARTDLGALVYRSKPYRGDFTPAKQLTADEIVERMVSSSYRCIPPTLAPRPLRLYLLQRQVALTCPCTWSSNWRRAWSK